MCIRDSLARDHPDNVVSKLVSHAYEDGTMWFLCRWKGFSKEVDSWQTSDVLQHDCPEVIREYARRLQAKGKTDEIMQTHLQRIFPADAVAKTKLRMTNDEDASDTDSDTMHDEPPGVDDASMHNEATAPDHPTATTATATTPAAPISPTPDTAPTGSHTDAPPQRVRARAPASVVRPTQSRTSAPPRRVRRQTTGATSIADLATRTTAPTHRYPLRAHVRR